jgi:hypothetical protein
MSMATNARGIGLFECVFTGAGKQPRRAGSTGVWRPDASAHSEMSAVPMGAYAQRCIKIHDLRIGPKHDFVFCSEPSAARRSPLRLPCSAPGLTSQNERLMDVFSCTRSAEVRRSRQGRKALRWHPPVRRKAAGRVDPPPRKVRFDPAVRPRGCGG